MISYQSLLLSTIVLNDITIHKIICMVNKKFNTVLLLGRNDQAGGPETYF